MTNQKDFDQAISMQIIVLKTMIIIPPLTILLLFNEQEETY